MQTSQKLPEVRLLKTDTANQVAKARFIAQIIKDGLHSGVDQAIVTLAERAFQAFDRRGTFAQAGKDQSLAVIRGVLNLGQAAQALDDRAGFRSPAQKH